LSAGTTAASAPASPAAAAPAPAKKPAPPAKPTLTVGKTGFVTGDRVAVDLSDLTRFPGAAKIQAYADGATP
jgi:hypothetical protein